LSGSFSPNCRAKMLKPVILVVTGFFVYFFPFACVLCAVRSCFRLLVFRLLVNLIVDLIVDLIVYISDE
jgi:hypothetical protein